MPAFEADQPGAVGQAGEGLGIAGVTWREGGSRTIPERTAGDGFQPGGAPIP